MATPEIERLVQQFARLPGMGPRSARRAVLYLLKRRETHLHPLTQTLAAAGDAVRNCSVCGNLDGSDPCAICADPERDAGAICIIEDVADLWALERAAVFRGRYHVLGGTLSAIDGIGPEDLRIPALVARVSQSEVKEVILATNATVEGQTTAHYIMERLEGAGVEVSRLAQGLPMGGELHYLDDGTLGTALRLRRKV